MAFGCDARILLYTKCAPIRSKVPLPHINIFGLKTEINILMHFSDLDYTCTAQFEDGKIILKTSATGRPRVKCHPRLCPSRIDLTAEKNTSWVQVIENGLIRHFCNVTKAVYGKDIYLPIFVCTCECIVLLSLCSSTDSCRVGAAKSLKQ